MRNHTKEIILGLLIAICLIGGIAYFYRHLQTQQRTEQIDLYALVPANPHAVMHVNRPQIVASLMLSNPQVKEVFQSSLEEVFLSLIAQSPSHASALLSMHAQGVLFYTKAEESTLKRFEDMVFQKHFPAYPPTRERREEITYYYYPDTANRFFGFYYHGGIMVAGYNRKLLEEVALRQMKEPGHAEKPFPARNYPIDSNAPINLFFSTDDFALFLPLSDSTSRHAEKDYFFADIFTNEGKICCNGQLDLSHTLDSASLNLTTDTLSQQIRERFPTLGLDIQFSQEEKTLFYTGCTTKPS